MNVRQDRLCVFRVGKEHMALPLSDVQQFAPASGLRRVGSEYPWIAGAVQESGTGTWMPVIDLARLWDDDTLAAPWSHLIITGAGVAIGASSYTTTPEPVAIVVLRPAPGNPALGRAAVLDDRPMAIVNAYTLISTEQWRVLAASA